MYFYVFHFVIIEQLTFKRIHLNALFKLSNNSSIYPKIDTLAFFRLNECTFSTLYCNVKCILTVFATCVSAFNLLDSLKKKQINIKIRTGEEIQTVICYCIHICYSFNFSHASNIHAKYIHT